MTQTTKAAITLLTLTAIYFASCSDIETDSEFQFLNEGGDCLIYHSYEIDIQSACYFTHTESKAFCLQKGTQSPLEIAGCFMHKEKQLIIFSDTVDHASTIYNYGFETCQFDSIEANISDKDQCPEK